MCFIHLRKSTNLFQINISRRNRTNARQRELFRTTSHQSLPIDIMKMTTYFIISVSIYSDMIELHSLVNILIDLFGVEAKIVVVRVQRRMDKGQQYSIGLEGRGLKSDKLYGHIQSRFSNNQLTVQISVRKGLNAICAEVIDQG
jgi:hypothetical protein